MRKGILSLENLDQEPNPTPTEPEVTPEVVAELETDAAMSESRAVEAEAADVDNQVEEAESIRATTDEMADSVEASLEPTTAPALDEAGAPIVDGEGKATEVEVPGEGLDEEEARRVEITVEHFARRLNFKKKMVPSLEGFKDPKTRVEKTKELAANLRSLSAALDAKIVASQEGWWDNLKHRFGSAFTSSEALAKEAEVTGRSAISRGFKEGEVFNAPGWAQALPTEGGEGSAETVIKALEDALAQIKASDVRGVSQKIVKYFEDIGHELKSNKGVGTEVSPASVERLRKMEQETKALGESLPSPDNSFKNDKKANFKSIENEAQAKKILALIKEITVQGAQGSKEFGDSWDAGGDAMEVLQSRWTGEDKKIANQVGKNVDEIWTRVWSINNIANARAYAALKYVKASTK